MKTEKYTEVVFVETPAREVFSEICWGLAVLGHLLILSHLYFGTNVQSDNDPHNWDWSQLVAVSAVWVYVGVFSFLSCWSCDMFERSRHLTSGFNVLAMTLPITSCIFSLIGIGMVLWESAVFSRERISLVILYALNIVFISTFSKNLGLWEVFPTSVVEQIVVEEEDDDEGEEAEEHTKHHPHHHHHNHHPFSKKKKRDAWQTISQAFPG